MNRDDAIKKIKKCLALARSANEHEAGIAMRQAQAMMAQHRVTDHELSLVDVGETRVKARCVAISRWEVALAKRCADAFGCEQFSHGRDGYNDAGNYYRLNEYVFVGLDAAHAVAGYAFDVLSRQCARARLAHIAKQPKRCKAITKTARGDAFAEGWVYRVSELVERFAQPARDAALLLAYLEVKHPDLKKVKPRDNGAGTRANDGHRMAGWNAGANAQLNRGVGGVPARELLS